MDSCVIAHRTYNPNAVRQVLSRPEIFAVIAEDGQTPEDIDLDVFNDCWLSMMEGDLFVGCYKLHALNRITVKAHAQILPEYRKKYSRDTGIALHEYIYNKAPAYLKVVVEIPTIYPNVKQFATDIGFREEGINRSSYLKGGEVIDQWMLGITRTEIGEFLNG
jgi:hypothetical protein